MGGEGATGGVNTDLEAQGITRVWQPLFGDPGDSSFTVFARRAIESGAQGYLLKGDSDLALERSLKQLMDGGAPISASIARHLIGTSGRRDTRVPRKCTCGSHRRWRFPIQPHWARGTGHPRLSHRNMNNPWSSITGPARPPPTRHALARPQSFLDTS